MSAPKVKDHLRSLGLAPLRSLGQNFLKDQNIVQSIVDAVLGLSGRPARVLEIGSGLGALTRPLLAAGARVWAVELDRGLAGYLSGWPENGHGLTVLNQDILTLDPGPLRCEAGGPLTVCGNLPYNLSSRILFWFLNHRACGPGGIFMLQKEMAQRLTAGPGSRDYGRLAAALSLWFDLSAVVRVPLQAFHPQPRVESAVVALKVSARPPEDLDPDRFGRFSAAVFQARRKTLFNNLAPVYGREKVGSILADLNLNPGLRADTLKPEMLAEMARRFEA